MGPGDDRNAFACMCHRTRHWFAANINSWQMAWTSWEKVTVWETARQFRVAIEKSDLTVSDCATGAFVPWICEEVPQTPCLCTCLLSFCTDDCRGMGKPPLWRISWFRGWLHNPLSARIFNSNALHRLPLPRRSTYLPANTQKMPIMPRDFHVHRFKFSEKMPDLRELRALTSAAQTQPINRILYKFDVFSKLEFLQKSRYHRMNTHWVVWKVEYVWFGSKRDS